jgi:hypothetical protein
MGGLLVAVLAVLIVLGTLAIVLVIRFGSVWSALNAWAFRERAKIRPTQNLPRHDVRGLIDDDDLARPTSDQ